MNALFKDPKLQADFENQGYVIIPFLTEEDVACLTGVYNKYFSQVRIEGLYPTLHWNSLEANLNISEAIVETFKKAADKIFNDYQFLVGHYMTKSNIGSREFELHQDWSIVEEDINPVAQIWCPLADTAPENGGMFVINKSHRFFDNYRSGSLHRFHISLSSKNEKYVTPLNIKAGYALCYHNSLLHGSYPNKSNEPRVVAMANVTAKNAPILYFQKSSGATNQVDVYEINRNILINNLPTFEKGGLPAELAYIRSINYTDKEITEDDILQKVNGALASTPTE